MTDDYRSIIEKLRNKYSDGKQFSKLSDLIDDNPEIPFKTLSNCSNELFGMSLKKYFESMGILVRKEEERNRKKKEVELENSKKMEEIRIGSTLVIGKYWQNEELEDGKTGLEWIVISKENNRVLLLCKKGIEVKAYDSKKDKAIWKNCELRKWLNNDFYDETFSEDEKMKICKISLYNKENAKYMIVEHESTEDKVFCLSVNEIDEYYGIKDYSNDFYTGRNADLICDITDYVKKKILQSEKSYMNVSNIKSYRWWTRSFSTNHGNLHGKESSYKACVVDGNGCVGKESFAKIGIPQLVRPALWYEVVEESEDQKKNRLEKESLKKETEKKEKLKEERIGEIIEGYTDEFIRNCGISFLNKYFTQTYKYIPVSCLDYVEKRGGIYRRDVSKKTNYLICDQMNLDTLNYKKAEELISEGQELIILTKDKFIKLTEKYDEFISKSDILERINSEIEFEFPSESEIDDTEDNASMEKVVLPFIEEDRRFHTIPHPGYFDNTFKYTVFRGYKKQIEKAVEYLQSIVIKYKYCGEISIRYTEEPEIFEFRFNNPERDDSVDKMIKMFPELKVMAFFEVWKFKYADAYVVYSAPGYEYITNFDYVGYVDYKQDDDWTSDHNPCRRFIYEFSHYSTSDEIRIDYMVPFKKEWDTYNYLIKKDDGFYVKKGKNNNEINNNVNISNEKKRLNFEDYSIEGGNTAWDYLLQTYKKPIPEYEFVPFEGQLIATPDLLWFQYSNKIIDELVEKYNYENEHFDYNYIDCYDEILFNRSIAKSWFDRGDEDDLNVMDPFPYYGVDNIDDFTKSLLSLLIATGKLNCDFKQEAIERIGEISNSFLRIDAGFVKNVMEGYDKYNEFNQFNEKIIVKYDGKSYLTSKWIIEGGY